MKGQKTIKISLIVISMLLGACSNANNGSPSSSAAEKPSSSSVASQSSSSVAPSSSSSSARPSSSSSSAAPSSSSSSDAKSSSNQNSKSSDSSTSRVEPSSSSIPVSSSEPSSSVTPSSSEPSSSSTELAFEPFKTTINVKLAASLNKEKSAAGESYDLEFAYDDEYFLRDAKEYDNDLSMLSFASSVVSTNVLTGLSFYGSAGFTDFTTSGYEKATTVDSIGYMFAHKTVDSAELFAVSVRGFDYQLEWADNFLIGESGDHLGFSLRAMEIYEALQGYVTSHANGRTIKLWVSGYSRGGAVSNVLAHYLMTGDLLTIDSADLFAYTFEAPACLDVENCLPYENVHNINNANDLIPLIPPAQFGLGRCGVDYQIYNEDVADILKNFDEGAIIPEFAPIDADRPIEKDSDLVAFILDCVFNLQTDDEEMKNWTCNTREEYYNRYQAAFTNTVGLIFGLSAATRASILSDVSDLGFGVLSILSDGQSLANFLKTYLDKDQLSYDEATLVEDCTALRNAIVYLFLRVLLIYSSDEYRPSLERLIDMHYPETVYVLLLRAHK